MKILSTLFLALTLLIFYSTTAYAQRPVRSTIFPHKETTDVSTETPTKKESTKRFTDTIAVGKGSKSAVTVDPENLPQEVDKAMKLFNNQQYADACDRFVQLAGTIKQDDPLLYEVQFMQSECASVNAQLEKAEKILIMLTTKKNVPPQIMERSLVRLGHVFCELGKSDQASKAFGRLQQEFPQSQYLQLANCESVK
ncbi:MAG: hypothetical protein IPM69_03275 [Ignavibacteria bacterium]|nr:hypothetical protein [Ignavibacteria bacterium]